MADPGYVDLPSTAHFSFEYDQTLNQVGATALGNALKANAETDYGTISSWFDSLTPGGVPDSVGEVQQKPLSRMVMVCG
jgi:hypothetical protein